MNKFLNTRFMVLLVAALALMTFNACKEQISKYELSNKKQDTPPGNIFNPTGGYGNITGKVVTTGNNPVSGVEVRAGNAVAYTDSKGGYFLKSVTAAEQVLVDFKSDVYTSTQKVITVKNNCTSYLDATVITVGNKTTISGATGGSVNFNNAKVDFTANSFVDSKGNAYTGTVQVKATWFDPTSATFYGCFPGDFKGVRTDNSVTQIESFGFVSVEITNGGEKLQLGPSKLATITMPIPSKLVAKAPNTIPMWYYDESKGQWFEQGTATKTGNNYVGKVSHFSNWNCDMPTITSYIHGRVVDTSGSPISFAHVFSEGVDYTGSSRANTDDDGYFKLAVKSSSQAKIWAKYYIFESASQTVTTEATGQTLEVGDIRIAIDTMNIVIVVGTVIDNGNNPVQGIYVHLKDSTGKTLDYINTNKDGKFKFFCGTGTNYTLEFKTYSYDSSSNTKMNITTPAQPGTMDIGTVKLDIGGSTVIGRVLDSLNNPVRNIYVSTTPASGGTNQRDMMTDSLGKFSLWVKPNMTFKLNLYNKGVGKSIDVTSPNLGETKDLGDIIIP